MDFSFSEEQQAVSDLAKQILEGTINPDRLKELKANGEHLDRKAWQEATGCVDPATAAIVQSAPEPVAQPSRGFVLVDEPQVTQLVPAIGRQKYAA
mgnify:CR=1 FL=1